MTIFSCLIIFTIIGFSIRYKKQRERKKRIKERILTNQKKIERLEIKIKEEKESEKLTQKTCEEFISHLFENYLLEKKLKEWRGL